MVVSRDRVSVGDGTGDDQASHGAQGPTSHPSDAGAMLDPAILDPTILDPHAIFAAIGEIPYAWRIDSDALAWGPNVHRVLASLDPAALASGKSYAQLIDPQSASSRFDAVTRSGLRDEGAGVPYLVQYALRASAAAQEVIWVEDSGRWFAGPDGKPMHACGVVRVINERHEREQKLTHLSRFDTLTGELNRDRLTEILDATIEEALKLRSSCGFLLAAIDDLGRINEAYGFDVADEVIAAVAKRMHSKMRGKDHLGRVSGNKFGIILNNCTPDDLLIAADRLLAGIRSDVMQTSAGPVAATVTIEGLTRRATAATVNEG